MLNPEQSINSLRAEIIAQDWELSSRRLATLRAALENLGGCFQDRAGFQEIVRMAASLVEYVARRGDRASVEAIALLKEILAHIVSLYEEDCEPIRVRTVHQAVLARVAQVKRQMQDLKQTASVKGRDGEAVVAGIQGLMPDDLFSRSADVPYPPPQPLVTEAPCPEEQVDDLSQAVFEAAARFDSLAACVDRFQRDLVFCRELGDELAAALLREKHSWVNGLLDLAGRKLVARVAAGSGDDPLPDEVSGHFRECRVGGRHVLLDMARIVAVRKVSARRSRKYRAQGTVPGKEVFRDLEKAARAGRFPVIAPRAVLKKMALPVLSLRGPGFMVTPKQEDTTLLLLGGPGYVGILFCAELAEEAVGVHLFNRAARQDIRGIALLEDGDRRLLLDVHGMLEREGLVLDV